MAAKVKLSKNQFRREKKKQAKQEHAEISESASNDDKGNALDRTAVDEKRAASPKVNGASRIKSEDVDTNDFDIEAQDPGDLQLDGTLSESDDLYQMYKSVMNRFQDPNADDSTKEEAEKPQVFFDDDNDDIPDEEEEAAGPPKLSKKKRKQQNMLSVAELKALVEKPETVEWTDTSAPDPRLLVHIKAARNVIPVPTHWSLKREYLSSKRGVEKAAFTLPKFILDTGITEMRDAVLEKQDQASLKQKQRERVQPKMGKLDIDYQKLYEAFFKFQTKPELTRYGEVYYEGKEFETNLRHMRPGELSQELKEALNIPPGAPPPWLINQQRFGPPPSYPALKIPGLNAPPPPGGSWGFHPGGYGKPPVDEFNRPLYGGDIFGVLQPAQNNQYGEPVEKTLWGELQAPEEEESEEEDEEGDEEEDDDEAGAADDRATTRGGIETPSGLETPGGTASAMPSEYAGGVESIAGDFDIRKSRRSGTDTETSAQPRQAYQVIPEQQTRVSGFFGGDRTYDLKAASAASHLPVLGQDDQERKRKKPGDIDVAVDPDALQAKDGLDKEALKKIYEAGAKQERAGQWGMEDDLSDMIATESRKRQKRDEERRRK